MPHLPSPVLTIYAYPHSHCWSSASSLPLRQEALLPPLLLSDPEASQGLVTSWPCSLFYSICSWRCSQVYGGLHCICAPVSRHLIFLIVPGSDIISPIPETQLLLAFNMPQISLTWSFNEDGIDCEAEEAKDGVIYATAHNTTYIEYYIFLTCS